MFIQEIIQYKVKLLSAEDNNITDKLQVILIITDYNLNATARLDVNLIIIDLETTNRHPTKRYMHCMLRKLQQ